MTGRWFARWLGYAFVAFGCGGDSAPMRDASIPVTACDGDDDCDDSMYCNGRESCRPEDPAADERGCVAQTSAVCLAGQKCSEELDRCVVVDCTRGRDLDMDGVDSIDCGGFDCDDADPARAPGNMEFCDTADHDEDCDPSTFGVRDGDSDTFADAECCNRDGDTLLCGLDCDDTRATTNPSSPEVCNGVNDDCDGDTDEGVLTLYTVDADGDGRGSMDAAAMTMRACFTPMGYAERADDCNDDERGINPAVPEICDGAMVDENCDMIINPPELCDCTPPAVRDCALPGLCMSGREMCADGRWGSCTVMPAPDVCDGEDDDCDGATDEGLRITCYADPDNDRYPGSGAAMTSECPVSMRPEVGGCPSLTTNVVPFGTDIDCGPASSATFPGAPEICNDVDNDCDGTIDEEVSITCYVDEDDDTYAAIGTPPTRECPDPSRPTVGGCRFGLTNRAPSVAADCNDGNVAINPAALEMCDAAMVDENCDGVANPPSECSCSGMVMRPCPLPGACAAGSQTCASGMWGACSVSPRAETCNTTDDDCDGSTDEGLVVSCYPDGDNDTYAPTSVALTPRCPEPGREIVGGCPIGFTNRSPATSSDCNDAAATMHPGAPELCNRLDDNCVPDFELLEDADGDGHTRPSAPCAGGPFPKDDCNDTAADVYPGQIDYFGTPRCFGGMPLFQALTGRWCCQVGFTCDPLVPPIPSWDYDCSGTESAILSLRACRLPECIACGETGWIYPPGSPPACGAAIPAYPCGCGMGTCRFGVPGTEDPLRPYFECR